MAYPSVYNAVFTFADERGETTSIEHPIDTPTNVPWAALDLVAAQNHTQDLGTYYQALSTANLIKAELKIRTIDNATLGAAGSDVSNDMAYLVYTNPTGELAKLAPLRVPSPIDALFLPDLKTLDLTNTDFQALVDEIDAGVFISDGEQINGALGTNGVKKGYWRSKARRAKL